MRFREKIKPHTLRGKIILLCAVLVCFSCLIVIILMNNTEHQVQEIYDASAHDLLNYEASSLASELASISSHVNRMCADNEFLSTVQEQAKTQTKTPSILALSTISRLMDNAMNGFKSVHSCMVHTSSGDYFQLIHGYRSNFSFEATEAARLLSSSAAAGVLYGTVQKDDMYSTSSDVIPLIYHLTVPGIRDEIVVTVLLNEWEVYSSLNRSSKVQGTTFLVNSEGVPVTKSRSRIVDELWSGGVLTKDVLTHESERVHNAGTEYLVNTAPVGSQIPWHILNIADSKTLMPGLARIRLLMIVLILIMCFISICFSVLVSRSITRPIETLTKKMESVRELPTGVVLDEQYEGEAGILASGFNHMIGAINTTAAELREEKERARIEQLLKRRAELKALQAQINPHFLYNTLDSISWKAFDAGCEDISDMTVALANLFRTGLNRGNELVPLRDEISHVKSYLQIQKMRYDERFSFRIDVPEELTELYTVKLILQPLVENSIYHGIREKNAPGMIRIRVYRQDDRLCLCVEDDGVGFPRNSMEKINRNLASGMVVDKDSYGIYNVNERIKLYFGEVFGLSYTRRKGITTARILLPVVPKEEVERYVQYSDH